MTARASARPCHRAQVPRGRQLQTGFVLPLPVTQSSPPLPHTAPARWAKPHSGLAPATVSPASAQQPPVPADSLCTANPGAWLQHSEPEMEKFPDPPPHSPFTSKFCWSLQAEVLLVTRCQCPVPPKPFRPPAVPQPLAGTQHPSDPHCPAGPRLQQLVFFSPDVFSNQKRGKRGAAASGSSVSSSSLLLPVLRDSQSPVFPAKSPLSLRDISLLPQPSH